MKLKFILLVFIAVLLINTNIYSLKILEPLTKDLTYSNTADLGYFSAGEFFMISFLLEDGDNYHTISVDSNQIKEVIVEPTKKTQESIFTVIRLEDELSGNYSLKLLLISDTETKEVILQMKVTDDVIHTNLINYNPVIRYEQKETINLKLINKSNTTKTVIVTSDLPTTWFNIKKEKLNSEKTIILTPNSITETTYEYYPKEIGSKIINLKIYTSFEEGLEKYISYNLNVEVEKDLKAIYGSREHTYPLFNVNLIPIYFLNKIIKII